MNRVKGQYCRDTQFRIISLNYNLPSIKFVSRTDFTSYTTDCSLRRGTVSNILNSLCATARIIASNFLSLISSFWQSTSYSLLTSSGQAHGSYMQNRI